MKRWAGLAVLCGALLAQTTGIEVDPSKSAVEFVVGSTLHTVHGTFHLKSGSLQFDPQTGKASGELVVDAASGESGSEGRDRRMRKEILQTDRHPDIVFRPDRVEGKLNPDGASQMKLHGIFSIHGGEHEMTVPVDVQAAGSTYTATTHFVVPYIQWGMKNPSTFVLRVSDKVEITVQTVVRLAAVTSAQN
jgi:polyisoprenoid-binding protein YceI